MRRDPVNVEHLTLGGGVGKRYNHASVPLEVIRILEQEGVNGFFVAPTLRQKSLAELRAVSSYLDKQPNVRARDKLFAALVLRDFGAQLLAGRVTSPDQRPTKPQRNATGRPSTPDDHLRYVSGALAPYIKGGTNQADPPPVPFEAEPRPTEQTAPTSSTLTQTWQ